MEYPITRYQRYRMNQSMRDLVQEIDLLPRHFIAPLFVHELDESVPISSLPGHHRHSLQSLVTEAGSLMELGIQAVILFGIPLIKDSLASSSVDSKGIVQQAINVLKHHFPDLIVIADVCLCEYTDHGHCGLFNSAHILDHESTLSLLSTIAVSYADCGVDIVAPSGMMDGAVSVIRSALDHSGYSDRSIMSYSIKFASQFYGPFRDAAGSGDDFKGDRKHHQLSPTQRREALRDGLSDEKEGADFLMVKPAMPYQDLIRDLRNQSELPIVAYQVSGEYAMLMHGVSSGVFSDAFNCFYESLIGLRRSGADLIISYYAKEYCRVAF